MVVGEKMRAGSRGGRRCLQLVVAVVLSGRLSAAEEEGLNGGIIGSGWCRRMEV